MFRILLLAAFLTWHPVHVSVMSVEYLVEDEAFKGFLRIYYDDFLVDLSSIDSKKAEKGISVSSEESKEIIWYYLNKRLILYSGENILKPEIAGMSLTDNELKVDLVYKMKKRSKKIRIFNSILSDVYADQSNLVMLRYGKFEEGVKLTPEKREHYFKIK
jgi:hypothetical protein